MKRKILNKYSLTSDTSFVVSQITVSEIKKKKYSHSFISLMQKAMDQLKNKQKALQRYSIRSSQYNNQCFVHGLQLSEQKRSTFREKKKKILFNSTTNIKVQESEPTQKPQKLKIKTEVASTEVKSGIQKKQKDLSALVLKSIRCKKTYYLRNQKNFKIKKLFAFNETWTRRSYSKRNQNQNSQINVKNDCNSQRDQHIKPWDINQDIDQFNKFS